MVTQPEVAAIYTARFLKVEMQKDFLKVVSLRQQCCVSSNYPKVGECFVLCDAGGGTVVSGPVARNSNALDTESAYRMLCHTELLDSNQPLSLNKSVIHTVSQAKSQRNDTRAQNRRRFKMRLCVHRCTLQAMAQRCTRREILQAA